MSQRSIVLAIILFSLIIFGMIVFTFLELAQSDRSSDSTPPTQQPTPGPGNPPDDTGDQAGKPNPETPPLSEGLSLSREYRGGSHTIGGSLQLPNPCYDVSTSTTIAESFPEQVTLRINAVPQATEMCAQVIDERPISFKVVAAEKATFRVVLNGAVLPAVIPQLERTNE